MSGHPKHGNGAPPTSSQRELPSKQQAKPRSKELRADFLLNFQRPPAHQRPAAYQPQPRRSGRPSGKGGRTPTAFVRGRFVQSSFRIFVDGPSLDVLEASFSSDTLIDWPNVRSVDLACDEHPKCPICLEQNLVVPKITRCGHIFCLPCIMRYFILLQGQNLQHVQQCPVCKEKVSPEDLTSVRFQMTKALREDERFKFILVHREASSICVRGSASAAMAVSPMTDDCGDLDDNEGGEAAAEAFRKLPSEREPGWHFSRVVRLLPGEHAANLAREAEALRLYRPVAIGAGDTELLPSIDAAISLLGHMRPPGALAGFAEQPAVESVHPPWGCRYVDVATCGSAGGSSSVATVSTGEELEYDGAAAGPDDGEDCNSASASPAHGSAASPASAAAGSPSPAPLPAPRMSAVSRGGARILSFYQAEDGRLVFLEPFFTKLLLHEHGGRWDQLPASLPELRLERLHEMTMTEEVRKRYRFLAHLPLGSPTWFAEVDLRGQLSRETREVFAEDFAKRRQWQLKERAKSKREDRQSKQMAAAEEEKYWHSMNRLHPSMVEAPPTKQDFAVDLQGRCIEEPEVDPDADGAGAEAEEGAEDAAPTLADKIKGKMSAKAGARSGKASASVQRPAAPDMSASLFPALGGGAGSSSSASAWGTKVPQRASASAEAVAAPSDPVPVPDSWDDEDTPVNGQDASTLGDALEAALRSRAKSIDIAETPDPVAPAQNAAGKKKKGKAAKATTIRLFG